jgi:hypothetical protein
VSVNCAFRDSYLFGNSSDSYVLATVFDYQLSGRRYYLPSPHQRIFPFENHRQHFSIFPKKYLAEEN